MLTFFTCPDLRSEWTTFSASCLRSTAGGGGYFIVVLVYVHSIYSPIRCYMAQEKADAYWLFNPEIQERYPQVPDAVIGFMEGQFTDWKTCPQGLPWNRRRRRQLESAKAIVLHLFSGDKESSRKWLELQKLGY